jgi:hypothetical protein
VGRESAAGGIDFCPAIDALFEKWADPTCAEANCDAEPFTSAGGWSSDPAAFADPDGICWLKKKPNDTELVDFAADDSMTGKAPG